MRHFRLIPNLLALLAVVAGVGVPGLSVLCRGVDHVAVELAVTAMHCDETEAAASSDNSTVAESRCTDVPIGVDAPVLTAGDNSVVPEPLPPVLVAVLPATIEPPLSFDRVVTATSPPAHLLPLRSFVLLT